MASLDNFIDARQIQVSFVTENLKAQTARHTSRFLAQKWALVALLILLNIQSAFQYTIYDHN